MMPTSVLAPMLVVPTQTSFQWHLSSREPNFPPVFSIYLTAWLCKQMGTISCVGTPPRGLLCVHSGKPVCLMLQKRVQLCMATRSIMAPQMRVQLEILLGGG